MLEAFDPDLVHSHNLPDSPTVLAQELVGGRVPIVHDVHDLQSLRQTPYENGFPEPRDPLELERRAVEGSDAVSTVSEELLDVLASRYRLPPATAVFANYALRNEVPSKLPLRERPDAWPPRLVYQGTLSTNGGHYDLREIFAALVGDGRDARRLPVARGAGVPGAGRAHARPDRARPAARRRALAAAAGATTSAGPASTRT